MLCPNCGHQNPPESLFCGSCGTALTAAGGPAAGQDPTVVDTFAETGPATTAGPAAGAAAGAGMAAGAQPWGTEVNEPVPAVPPSEPAATWQEPDPTTAMPPTTAVPVAGAAAVGAAAGAAATGPEGGVPPGPPPGGPTDPDPDGSSNRGWIIAIVVLALLLVAAIIAFFLTRDSGTTSTTSTSTSSTTTSSTTTSTTSTSTSTTSTTRPSTTTTRPSTTTTAPTTTTTAPTTTTTTAKPSITSFTVPASVTQAQCDANAGAPTITLSWVTANTKSVTIGIANPQPYQQDLPATGSIQAPFACSNGTNTYYITAFGNDGSTAVESKNVSVAP